MKAPIVTIALSLGFSFAQAQHLKEAEVPAAVKQGFEKKYPGIKAEKWEKEGADYEAQFDLNKVESSAVFSANGTFKELEQEVKLAELPKKAADYCTKQFTGYKISETARITEESGIVQYEAELSKGKEHFDALFNEQGDFVKRSEVSVKQ